jgi:hypothetical protein
MANTGVRRTGLVLVGLLGALAGCFSYHARGGGPDFAKVAVDYHQPHRAVRWTYWWGLHKDEWSPSKCLKTAGDQCVARAQYCDQGVGRVEVEMTPYTPPLMLVTLGAVVPMRVTAYCATEPAHTTVVKGPE